MMMKIGAMVLLLVGISGLAQASAVPEISPGEAGNALALLAGAVLVIRGRRRS